MRTSDKEGRTPPMRWLALCGARTRGGTSVAADAGTARSVRTATPRGRC
jgi:hypothetical protein